jgi:DNA-binding winged helix-turn-helix (wHTH) protein/tetratricopeptide (TPR) repeat protein
MVVEEVSALAPLRFGRFVLDEAGFELRRDGQPVAIEPRALKLLLHLARNRQRAVPSSELAATLWADRVVSETSLKEAVNLARRAVGDAAGAQAVVATLRGHGYRFVAAINELSTPPDGAAAGESPHFVGRARELELLRSLAGEVGHGTARIVLLEGEAGIGKTTLIRRFANSAAASGFAVVRGHSDSDCGAPSYWTWIQVLRELLPRPEIATVRRTAPHSLTVVRRLASSEAIAEPAVVSSHDHRLWLFDDVAEVLRLFATACPLLIVLEDLQSATDDSLLLLRFLARHLEETRTMIVGTFRRAALADDHPLTATLTELRRVPGFSEMTLGGLVDDDAAALVGRRVAAPLVRELQRRTGGNPLFLKEILRHAANRFAADWYSRDDAAVVLQHDLAPPGIRDLVAQRVGRLDPDTRAIFDAAAVLGEQFELTDVAHLVGRRAARIEPEIEVLQAQGFFHAGRSPTARQFSHPVVREAALALLSPRRTQQLHERAARRFERTADDARRLPQLAYHALAALPLGSIDRAVRYGRAAAAQAATNLAYEDAAGLYRQTLAAAARRPRSAPLERAELLVALGEVSSRTADQATARQAALEGFRLAQQRRRPDLCARAACALGPTLLPLQPGTVDEQRVELLEEALRLIPPRDRAQRVRVLSELAVALYWAPDALRCMDVAENAVGLARKLGQPAPLAHALYARCIARWRPSAGRPDGAAVREAIRVADRAGEGDLAMAGAVRLGSVLAEAGEFEALDRLTANLEQRAQRLGYPQARLWPLIFQASQLTRRRRLADAEAAIARVRAAALEAWEPAGEPYCAFLLGMLRLEQGTFEGLLEAFDRLATWVPDLPVDAPLPLILAGVGEVEKAMRTYAQLVARRPWESSDHMGTFATLIMLAACAARFEDADTAAGIIPILAPHAGEYVVVPSIAGVLAPITHTVGELCGTVGRYDEAVAYLERASDECRRAELRSDLVRTQLAWARVLARRNARGDRRRAVVLGREAQRRAEDLAAPLLIADAAEFNASVTTPSAPRR